jgi:serine-type D-Ala-D-Ala carboxypeptidase/endopeptidase (penicillin-binding protein 4)
VLLTPAGYAYGTFVSLWRELGGEVDGKLRVESAPPDARPLLTFDSLSLGEIVRLTNKYSSNLMARHLLLTLGAERYGAPATVAKGIAAIGAWVARAQSTSSDLEIDNGSGLSRKAHVSAEAMANVLRAAYRSPFAPEFLASLPLAGIDGTLRTRMNASPAGSVRLKTGHIDDVSGVAGYVTAASGKTYVLVCLINDARVDSGAGDALHAALVKWILENLSTAQTRCVSSSHKIAVTPLAIQTPKPRYRKLRCSRRRYQAALRKMHRAIGTRAIAIVAPIL